MQTNAIANAKSRRGRREGMGVNWPNLCANATRPSSRANRSGISRLVVAWSNQATRRRAGTSAKSRCTLAFSAPSPPGTRVPSGLLELAPSACSRTACETDICERLPDSTLRFSCQMLRLRILILPVWLLTLPFTILSIRFGILTMQVPMIAIHLRLLPQLSWILDKPFRSLTCRVWLMEMRLSEQIRRAAGGTVCFSIRYAACSKRALSLSARNLARLTWHGRFSARAEGCG